MNRRRVAIVGCGGIAAAHQAAIERRDDLELVCGIDPAASARERVENDWGCPTFPDVAAALAGSEFGAAIVCAPPARHREIVLGLLGAGVDVLCEKPLATSVADARAMCEEAERRGRVLMVSSKFRYVKDLESAGKQIRDGVIGTPLLYEVAFCAYVPMAERWNTVPELSGGGVLMDNGPHAFDVLSHVIDAPVVSLDAGFSVRAQAPTVEDTAELRFTTAKGTLGRIALSWSYFTKDLDYLTVQGSEGTLAVGWTGGRLRKRGERDWTGFGSGYDKNASFDGLLDDFVRWSTEGVRPSRAADPVRAVELIERAYRSAESLPTAT